MISMPSNIRVLLADDHAILRRGIANILSTEDGIEVVGEVGDGLETLEFLGNHPVDVLVLDLSLPNIGGIEILRRLSDIAPRVHTVVLTMYPEDQLALHLINAGALAYLSKSRPPAELIVAIRRAATGHSYVTDTLASLATQEGNALPHELLTAREQQVFLRILQGTSVSNVSYELNLSISTISNHLSHIRQKLNCESNGDILRYGHRMALLG